MRLWRALAIVLWALVLPAAARAADLPAGWTRIDLADTGTYFYRYVPASLDRSRPAPLIVFLHGAYGNPEAYRNYVRAAAEAAGAVLALPKSRGVSWTPGVDDAVVAGAIASVEGALPVDGRRVSLAGHSAGGAYAYLLAYASNPGYSAVFTLGAPYYPVPAVADRAYQAPIRLYYGAEDLNYTGGAYSALKLQWDRLGVPHEEEVRPGYGHNSWPNAVMEEGFRFLVGEEYGVAPPTCVPTATRLCLQGERFAVEVAWQDGNGGTGPGRPTAAVSADSAVFWFFAPDNWELLVKVIDGCAVNGRYWVFESAMTDVRYTLTVTDTRTGAVARYANPGGENARPILDTAAFGGCPP